MAEDDDAVAIFKKWANVSYDNNVNDMKSKQETLMDAYSQMARAFKPEANNFPAYEPYRAEAAEPPKPESPPPIRIEERKELIPPEDELSYATEVIHREIVLTIEHGVDIIYQTRSGQRIVIFKASDAQGHEDRAALQEKTGGEELI